MKYLLFIIACLWLLPGIQAQNCAVYIHVSPANGTGPWNLKALAVQDTTAPPPHPQIVAYAWSTGATTDQIQVGTVGQYCVTATFDNGCTTSKCVQVMGNSGIGCWLNLSSQVIPGTTNRLVKAQVGPSSAGPFTYLWNTGQTTDQITVTTPGNYCATVTNAQGNCTSDTCIDVWWKTCGLSIAQDAQKNVNATATGAAPFTYLWSNGATTASLSNPPNGNYCLTMTDATGCTDVACITIKNPVPSCFATLWHSNTTGLVTAGLASSNSNPLGLKTYTWSDPNLPNQSQVMPGLDWTSLCVTITNSDGCSSTKCIINEYKDQCIWSITPERINSVAHKLTPFGRYGDNATYVWSTGETTKSIIIEDAGTYSVTITGTCTDVLSTTFEWTNDLMVIMNNVPVSSKTDIKTWLIEYTPAQGGTLSAVQEKLLETSSNMSLFQNLPDGDYLIKSACMPGSPGYADRLPTYHKSNLWWHEATSVTIPSLVNSGFGGIRPININFIEGLNPGGPGFVGGLVSEGANFTHNGTENAAPIYPATVILYDQDGKIVAGVSTAPDGTFEIKSLPFGTYKLMVDAPGLPQHTEWITIGPTQPQLTLNIAVKKSLSSRQLDNELTFSVWPNPVFDGQIHLDAPAEGLLMVKNIQGQILYSQKTNPGVSQFTLKETTPGIYFVELQTAEGHGTKKIVVGQKP